MFDTTDQLAVNTIRTLSLDAIQKANSGHPGLPMGSAPMAYVLWSKFLNVNPKTSRKWSNRDRFVLSAGHGSAMLYSLLHLAGYNVTTDDLKGFRQWQSKPGLLYCAAKCASAIAIPTALAIPCPKGPVVASTPSV